MEHAHTIKALTEKRAELAADLEKHQAAARQALTDIEHIDATLREEHWLAPGPSSSRTTRADRLEFR